MNEERKEEMLIPKTKHKSLKILLAVLLIGILAAGGYFLYKEKFANPTKTVIQIMSDSQKELNKTIGKIENDKFKINGLVTIDANLTEELKGVTELLKNIDLQFNGEIDTKNNLGNITLNTKYKKEQLVDVKAYYENSNLYLLLDGLYDKYLQFPLESTETSVIIPNTKKENLSNEDIKVLINSIMEASKKAMEKLKFDRISTSITIDGKEKAVYNYYTILDNNGIKSLFKDITNALAKDNNFLNVYKKVLGDTKDFTTSIEQDIEKLNLPGTYKISYYTTKDLFGQKLVSERLEITNDGVTSTFSVDKINNDESIVSINSSGITLSCRVKKTNSVFNMSLSFNALGMNGKFDINTNFEKINEVTKTDVSNSKKIDELTEKEQQDIMDKLQKSKGMLSFIEDISKLTTLTQ